jgi:hypothetical protein
VDFVEESPFDTTIRDIGQVKAGEIFSPFFTTKGKFPT